MAQAGAFDDCADAGAFGGVEDEVVGGDGDGEGDVGLVGAVFTRGLGALRTVDEAGLMRGAPDPSDLGR